MRVLKDDEKRVVKSLLNAGGTMLQREARAITRKTGFSRVKLTGSIIGSPHEAC